MTGSLTRNGPRTTKWNAWTDANVLVLRANSLTGLGNTFAGGYEVSAGTVLLIDQISISITFLAGTADSVERVEMEIDDGDTQEILSWSFPHVTGTAREHVMTWNPRGRAVVFGGTNIDFRTTAGGSLAFVSLQGRLMSKQEALDLQIINGTEFLTGGETLTASTNNEIVAPVDGKTVEITGFTCFGAHDSSSAEEVTLSFSDDGTTNVHTIAQATSLNQNTEPSPESMTRFLVDDCLIQGPVGYGVYANPAGADPLGEEVRFAVCGRYVDRNTCYEPTGVRQTGQSTIRTGADNFWFHIDETDLASDGYYELFARLASQTNSTYMARLNGYVYQVNLAGGAPGTQTSFAFSTQSENATASAAAYTWKSHFGTSNYMSGTENGLALPHEVGGLNMAITVPVTDATADGGITCWGTLNHFDRKGSYSTYTYKSI